MGAGDQRHAPAALSPEKTRSPLYRRLGGPEGRATLSRKISAPTGIRSPDRPAPSESLYRLSKMMMMMMMMIIIIIIIHALSDPQSPEHSLSSNCGCTTRPRDATRNFRQEQEMLPFSITFRPSLGHTHLLFNRYQGSFKEAKRPRCEVDSSPPSSAKVKNKWSPHHVFMPCIRNTLPLPSDAITIQVHSSGSLF
jgi:hypothetical protein